ncbi:hypothetical protein ABZS66_34720 [Dactylosporangium sp. NPDC005572]|uniref:hypothetical protein n=1 Tax=Dactylosporangium sp. NPDC005572 TaxID=3156889 RepID=UPI0033B5BF7F
MARWWPALLGLVPLLVAAADGAWPAGVVLAVVVAATAFVSPSPRSAWVLAGLACAAFLGCWLWSAFPPGAGSPLRPPAFDWYVPACVAAGLLFVVAFGVRLQHAQPMASDGRDGPARVLVLGLSGVLALCCGAGTGLVPDDGLTGDRTADLRTDAYLPLPAGLEVRRTKHECLGAHARCTVEYEVWASDGRPVDGRLAAHLRDRGWPAGLAGSMCRPVRGIFTWEPSCLDVSIGVTKAVLTFD